ncbi:MAG TPA: hypothetical protein VKV04_10835 [Verrucomicrobiae bacterium]|nr:hypothetical protein [Verrucomicrobiae bacterium]
MRLTRGFIETGVAFSKGHCATELVWQSLFTVTLRAFVATHSGGILWAYQFNKHIMSTRAINRKFDFDSSEENEDEAARKDDLVELVLGPLGDQIDRGRLEILAAVKDVRDSVEIIAREIARRAK